MNIFDSIKLKICGYPINILIIWLSLFVKWLF